MTEKKLCVDANFIVRYLGSDDPASIYRQNWTSDQRLFNAVSPYLTWINFLS
ncbi:hypothetical protein [Aphanothece hegewaldii]|uniref:hypothetical protein n=1 Tax=Aphanothece hegewaldii TaxID=1521625 RepID=UPI0015E773F2|nr:hypothetical protein [Aphanothece hegewaldii]